MFILSCKFPYPWKTSCWNTYAILGNLPWDCDNFSLQGLQTSTENSWVRQVSDKMLAPDFPQRFDKVKRQTKSNFKSGFHYESRKKKVICSLGFYQLLTAFSVFRISVFWKLFHTIISLFFTEWEWQYCQQHYQCCFLWATVSSPFFPFLILGLWFYHALQFGIIIPK